RGRPLLGGYKAKPPSKKADIFLSFVSFLVNQVTPDTRAHLSFSICVALSKTLLLKSNWLHFANETVCDLNNYL
ncbi:hypothetical protein, partial [Vibrio lentus]|uniref:hypothetical protein n=1 Tax=Vibrio lentus TaxID=136468 RepID=UPI0035EBDAE1